MQTCLPTYEYPEATHPVDSTAWAQRGKPFGVFTSGVTGRLRAHLEPAVLIAMGSSMEAGALQADTTSTRCPSFTPPWIDASHTAPEWVTTDTDMKTKGRQAEGASYPTFHIRLELPAAAQPPRSGMENMAGRPNPRYQQTLRARQALSSWLPQRPRLRPVPRNAGQGGAALAIPLTNPYGCRLPMIRYTDVSTFCPTSGVPQPLERLPRGWLGWDLDSSAAGLVFCSILKGNPKSCTGCSSSSLPEPTQTDCLCLIAVSRTYLLTCLLVCPLVTEVRRSGGTTPEHNIWIPPKSTSLQQPVRRMQPGQSG